VKRRRVQLVSALDDLLALQVLDTRLDQLRHQLSALPVRTELTETIARRSEAAASAAIVQARLKELRDEQSHLEDEALAVEAKAGSIESNLYSGTVVAHKDLEALQAEHRMLKSRQAHLEDRAIGVMEDAEPVESESAAMDALLGGLDDQILGLEERLRVESGDVGIELEQATAERVAAVEQVASELLAAYEPLRKQMGGIAVAKLTGSRCEGCRMEIPSAQLESVRKAPADSIANCPECGRILVR